MKFIFTELGVMGYANANATYFLLQLNIHHNGNLKCNLEKKLLNGNYNFLDFPPQTNNKHISAHLEQQHPKFFLVPSGNHTAAFFT